MSKAVADFCELALEAKTQKKARLTTNEALFEPPPGWLPVMCPGVDLVADNVGCKACDEPFSVLARKPQAVWVVDGNVISNRHNGVILRQIDILQSRTGLLKPVFHVEGIILRRGWD